MHNSRTIGALITVIFAVQASCSGAHSLPLRTPSSRWGRMTGQDLARTPLSWLHPIIFPPTHRPFEDRSEAMPQFT